MTVTYGSTKYTAQSCICTLDGTLAEVRAELAAGTAAGAYRWRGARADLLSISGTAAAAMAVYKVDKGSGTK
jgi:hypothetical protein